ncbi:MAG: acetyl-CoA carboxylase carboxyltransferase subunit alpha [Acidobacteria bacterium RIFCSPLOWO2_12_FULL_54_10]|nr:MAG: acetyl-CoA carboxylase carboxyltransferase subunit alpha [Acidobacteria bacterium RIFCSPLOWO2_12_FULL_54_10]
MAFNADKARRELEKILREIDALGKSHPGSATEKQIGKLSGQIHQLKSELTAHVTPWQRVQLARHPQRPHTLDYVQILFQDFTEIHGDRSFGDDPAMIAGMAWFQGQPVTVIGHQKGHITQQKLERNFGMPKPEGYRKALRVMQMGAKFHRPVISFVDTPGAYPGIDSEERGQAEAIARNLREMARLPVPIVVVVTGEGGSGGALAIAVGDRILMLENSVYSVISPEGCASITWRDSTKAELAADALKMTAEDLKSAGIIDEVIPEPPGGAHGDHAAMAHLLEVSLKTALQELQQLPAEEMLEMRYQKFRRMGQFIQENPSA